MAQPGTARDWKIGTRSKFLEMGIFQEIPFPSGYPGSNPGVGVELGGFFCRPKPIGFGHIPVHHKNAQHFWELTNVLAFENNPGGGVLNFTVLF